MSDHQAYGLERIAVEHLQETMVVQAEQVAFTLSPHRELEAAEKFKAQVVGSLALKIVSDESLFGRIPAQIDSRQQNRERQINFDVPTFEDLCEDVCDDYKVTARDVAMLYIGAGLALQLLEERIGINAAKVERLWNIMKNPSDLDRAIRTTSAFDGEQIELLVNAAMNLDSEARIARINALRFGLGIIFMHGEEIPEEDSAEAVEMSYEHRVTEQFISGLSMQLHGKSEYARTLMAFGRSEDAIDRNFSENIPDIGLAATFPMTIAEMSNVLRATH
jgi:hypothetical protein